MDVGLVGDGPAVTTAGEQLREASATVRTVAVAEIEDEDAVIVAAPAGDEVFVRANTRARATGTTLVTVELGGIGGRALPDVEGCVGVFGPGDACYWCLATRVAATSEISGESPESEPMLARLAGAIAGRETVRRLADGSAPGARVTEVPFGTRTLLPVPGCRRCDPEWSGRWSPPTTADDAGRSFEAAVAAAERAFDERLGPVMTVGEVASLPLPYYFAQLAATDGFSDASAARQAAGVSEDWDAAFMKAIGECLERYAAGIYRTARFREAPPDALEHAVDPGAFVRPADSGSIEEPIPWVPGEDLATGEERWLPAEAVVFPPPERRIRPQITTGLALGNSGAEAALGGLTEVIERDAAMLAWYSTYEALPIRVEDARYARLTRLAAVEGLSVSTVLLTQDVDLPVLAAAVQREDEWPRFAVGSAAGFDATDAAIGAVREAIQNWMELERMGPETAAEQESRIAAYATEPGAAADAFAGEPQLSAADVGGGEPERGRAGLDRLVELATDAGLEPAAAWTTTRDLRELGFEAVRVVVPRAQPLFLDDPFFGERAERVPESMGYAPALDREPHPFP